jgi:hypothetical protein
MDIKFRPRKRSSVLPSLSIRHLSTANAYYIILLLILALYVLYHLFSSDLSALSAQDRIPFDPNSISDHFSTFEGRQECSLHSSAIYQSPLFSKTTSELAKDPNKGYCPTRKALLASLSEGGRHGFDRPYTPRTCQYRWFTTAEICMILSRFEKILFVGDDALKLVYGAFNILLRENIALGALREWEMEKREREYECQCNEQFERPACWGYFITDSGDVKGHDGLEGDQSPYTCLSM